MGWIDWVVRQLQDKGEPDEGTTQARFTRRMGAEESAAERRRLDGVVKKARKTDPVLGKIMEAEGLMHQASHSHFQAHRAESRADREQSQWFLDKSCDKVDEILQEARDMIDGE